MIGAGCEACKFNGGCNELNDVRVPDLFIHSILRRHCVSNIHFHVPFDLVTGLRNLGINP